MPQQSWYYKNDSGNHYDLNVYHGDESGHVIIYSNQIIIVIDFGIKNDKSYSFYLDEELFQLSIRFENSSRHYSLKNMTSDAKIPINIINNYPAEHLLKAILLFLVLAILVVIGYHLL